MFLRAIYTTFVGLLIVTLVGVGISVFYPNPEYTDYFDAPSVTSKDNYQQRENERQRKLEEYDKAKERHDRVGTLVALTISLILVVISLSLLKTIDFLANGLLLGGLFTLIYSIYLSFETGDNIYKFIVLLVGLVLSLILGYLKFVLPGKGSSSVSAD
jgi:hypothetical protein